MQKTHFTSLEPLLPEIVWRHRWDDLAERLGLPYSSKYLANLDSKGEGPERLPFPNRSAYLKKSVINWLNERFEGN